MANNFYTQSGVPVANAAGNSVDIRNEFLTIQQGFDKMPILTGNGLNLVRVNASGSALETTTLDSSIHAAILKTTPVDADELGILDSAATFGLKKITFSNAKAFLKTYFDTFYAANSMIRLNTANGYGSSGTKIRRFLNVITNQGTDITYTDDAVNGSSFTINTNGVYAISYTDFSNTTGNLGVSLNATQLSTVVYSLTPVSATLFVSSITAGLTSSSGVTLYLNAGDIIRAHTDGVPAANTPFCWFTITRVR